jgi:hypothetical protein
MGMDPLMWRRPVRVASFVWPKALRTKVATGKVQDFRVTFITTDEDLMPLTPVRSEAAHIQGVPSKGSEDP